MTVKYTCCDEKCCHPMRCSVNLECTLVEQLLHTRYAYIYGKCNWTCAPLPKDQICFRNSGTVGSTLMFCKHSASARLITSSTLTTLYNLSFYGTKRNMSFMHQTHVPHQVPQNVLSVRGMTIDYISRLLRRAGQMKELVKRDGGDKSLHNKVLALLFCEPSTRTSCSFQAAMQRLGGTVINVNNIESSIQKGESLEDTIQTLSCYCNAIVLRHPIQGSAAAASMVATKPIINAGTILFLIVARSCRLLYTSL